LIEPPQWHLGSITRLRRFADYQGDLDKFEEHLTDIPVGTKPIDLSIDGGVRPPSAPHVKGWKDVAGEANLDIQSALPIIYPQNVTIYQVDDRYYAHQVDYGYHGLELFNDFLDAVSALANPHQYRSWL
jgi:tripeptidyl-peptidase-1